MGTEFEFDREAYSPRAEPAYVQATAVPLGSQLAEMDLPLAPAAPGLGTAVRVVHRGLRGWYWLAVLLGLLVGVPAGVLGWKLCHPMYRSEGLIRIAYSLPEVYQETDQNRPMASFDTFMQSQRSLITSQRVIDASIQRLNNDGWQLLPAQQYKFFSTYLKVDVKPRSELIEISVSDQNPHFAAAATDAVVHTYLDLFKKQQEPADAARMRVLKEDSDKQKGDIEEVGKKLKEYSAEYGTTNLDDFYQSAVSRVTRLEADLADVRAAKAMAPIESSATPQAPAVTRHVPLTEEQVAAVDAKMAKYLNERLDLELKLEQLAARGLLESHKEVAIAKRELEDAKARIAAYLDAFNQSHPDGLASAADHGSTAISARPVSTLTANETNLQKLYDEAVIEMKAMGQKRLRLAETENRLQTLKSEYEKLQKRIDTLEAEARLTDQFGRISIISSGTEPLSPERDLRLPVAAASAGAGLFLPAGLMILFSLLRRRFHYSDDTSIGMSLGQTPLIGILPNLKDGELDNDQSSAAAHGVHQMRVSLQSRMSGRSNAYLVTSAIAGEGKTSLTMSLGLSFAASRFKTLIIDADLVGRHLTGALDVTDIEGLYETLHDGNLRGRIRKFDNNLFVLSAGMANFTDACAVGPAAMRALLAEARRYFHTIIIDTGPILGSLEAAVIAQEVDGVLFAIGRGQQRQAVEKALRRLQSLDANIAGCIFNRAKDADFHSSPYGSSSHYTMSDKPVVAHPNAHRLSRFGPLVQAVANRIPAPMAMPN
jgi:polysaccharide biosynthesis transport protein